VTAPGFWTPADAAESDVLVHVRALDFFEHRKSCEACRPEPCPQLEAWRDHKASCRACEGDAPLSYPLTDGCRRRHAAFVEHGVTCPKCNPCPHLQAAIREVLDCRAARSLRSKAEYLRALQEPNL
jgi:hypothetical protein